MKHVRVDAGRVVEIIPAADGFTIADRFHPEIAATIREAGDEVAVGWTFDGSAFAPPEPAPAALAIPPAISRRQFFVQLALDGEITEDEAEAALATGTIPADMAAAIATLPAAQQFQARAFVKGATVFERHHPTTLALALLLRWDAAMLDQLWLGAATL